MVLTEPNAHYQKIRKSKHECTFKCLRHEIWIAKTKKIRNFIAKRPKSTPICICRSQRHYHRAPQPKVGKRKSRNDHKPTQNAMFCVGFWSFHCPPKIRRRDPRSDHKPTQNAVFCVGFWSLHCPLRSEDETQKWSQTNTKRSVLCWFLIISLPPLKSEDETQKWSQTNTKRCVLCWFLIISLPPLKSGLVRFYTL